MKKFEIILLVLIGGFFIFNSQNKEKEIVGRVIHVDDNDGQVEVDVDAGDKVYLCLAKDFIPQKRQTIKAKYTNVLVKKVGKISIQSAEWVIVE